MEVHEFKSKIGKYNFFYQYKLSVHSSVPGALGLMSVEQYGQTATSRGFQINTKKPLLYPTGAKALQPCAFLLVLPLS